VHSWGQEQWGPLQLHRHHQDCRQVERQQERSQTGNRCRRSGTGNNYIAKNQFQAKKFLEWTSLSPKKLLRQLSTPSCLFHITIYLFVFSNIASKKTFVFFYVQYKLSLGAIVGFNFIILYFTKVFWAGFLCLQFKLVFFGERILAKKLLIKCLWNWLWIIDNDNVI